LPKKTVIDKAMKLEKIPKKRVFDIPDGYFDELPQKIQKRIAGEQPAWTVSFIFDYKLQYVLPVFLLMVVGLIWFTRNDEAANVESILESVETEDMISYLDASEMTTEEILMSGEFNTEDAEEIETEVYDLHLQENTLDAIIKDMDLENITL
jgi:hypothetical protein